MEQSMSLCFQGSVPCHRHKKEGQFHNIPRSCSSKLGRVFLSLPSVSGSGFPLVTSPFSSESRNFPQRQNKQEKAGRRRTGEMTPSNERKSRAASYSLNRKMIAKTVTSSTHPIPGLAPKGHCVQTDNTKIVMNKDYFTTSCSHFRRELKVRLEKCLEKL